MVNALVKCASFKEHDDACQLSACRVVWIMLMFSYRGCTVPTPNAILHRRGLRKYGGKIQLKSHVQEILLEGGRATGVRLRNGKTIRATKVGAPSIATHDGCLVWSCRAPGKSARAMQRNGMM
jgi:hypothetical protein